MNWILIDPDTWEIFRPGIDGAMPNFLQAGGAATSGGSTYNPKLNAVVYYPGQDGVVYYLQLPSNPRTQKVTITTRTFGGAPITAQTGGTSYHMTRFTYVDKCGGYVNMPRVDVPAHFWKE
jgi:hypothetical protein